MIIVPRPFPIFRSINYIKGRSTGNDGSQYMVTVISSGIGSDIPYSKPISYGDSCEVGNNSRRKKLAYGYSINLTLNYK